MEYVDNFAAFGCKPGQVGGALTTAIKNTFTGAGLPVHEVAVCGQVIELLGWLIDGYRAASCRRLVGHGGCASPFRICSNSVEPVAVTLKNCWDIVRLRR